MKKTAYIILFFLFGAVLMIGLQAISSPPIIDDIPEIEHIQNIQSVKAFVSGDCYGFFRPVKNLIFWIFLRLAPGNQVVWHSISLFIYLMTTGIVVIVSSQIFKDKLLAVVAGIFWALAPTQVAALVWLSCSNILLMAALFFSALITYESSQKYYDDNQNGKASGFLALACGFYFLALLSYESAIVFPLIILLWDWLKKRFFLRSRHAVISHALFWIITVIYIVLRFFINKSGFTVENESFGPILPMQISFASAYFTFDHLFLWLWPFGKQTLMAGTFIWGKSATMLQLGGYWILFFAVIPITISLRRIMPIVSFGVAWFFISFIPLSNIIPLKNGPFSDYYLVIPSFGLVLILVGLIQYLVTKVFANKNVFIFLRLTALAVCVLIISWRIAAASLCFGWAKLWNDEDELFQKSLIVRPHSFTALICLARVRLLQGKLKDAEKLANEALSDAPWYLQAYNVLGDVYVKKGEYNRAREVFKQAILKKPESPYPYFSLGYIYETFFNDTEKAKRYYSKVFSMPKSSYSCQAAINLSRLLAMEGELTKAIEIMECALNYTPASLSEELHYNVAIAYREKGNIAMAQKHLRFYNKIISEKNKNKTIQ